MPQWTNFASLRRKLTKAIRNTSSPAEAAAACDKIKLQHAVGKAPKVKRNPPL
jgi:hypothetical protein